MIDERAIRELLRPLALRAAGNEAFTIDEFWVPASKSRADLAVVSDELWAFEIKSPRDSLRRLPQQVRAFSCLFDRCTAVLATKHLDEGATVVPTWWGLIEATEQSLVWRRFPEHNRSVDMRVLVQLLWRDEAVHALQHLGIPMRERLGRHSMWRLLLKEADEPRLKAHVRTALLVRDPRGARIPTRRFTTARAVAG